MRGVSASDFGLNSYVHKISRYRQTEYGSGIWDNLQVKKTKIENTKKRKTPSNSGGSDLWEPFTKRCEKIRPISGWKIHRQNPVSFLRLGQIHARWHLHWYILSFLPACWTRPTRRTVKHRGFPPKPFSTFLFEQTDKKWSIFWGWKKSRNTSFGKEWQKRSFAKNVQFFPCVKRHPKK